MKKKHPVLRRLIPWLIVLAALAALVLFVFIPIYSQQTEAIGEAPEIYFYDGDGKKLTLESDRLLFEMDGSTTFFKVTDKLTGKVWNSVPDGWNSDTIANGVKKEALRSLLNVTYIKSTKEEELNNYTYSIANQNYRITPSDGEIRVDYAIGKIERSYLIPTAITAERYKEFKDKMSKKSQKKITSYYTLYEPAKLDMKENKAEIIEKYPSVTEQALYVVKSDSSAKDKQTLEGFFAEAGYTQEDLALDAQLVVGESANNGPVFNASLIYRLEGDDLVVELPYDSLRCEGDYPFTVVTVLPMFGAAGTEKDGFILVPEGSGALIRYNNGKANQAVYYADMYGWDYGISREEVVHETRNTFGVFGMSEADGSFICMLEGASSYGGISADVSGRFNCFNTVYARYSVLHKDAYAITGRSPQTVYMYEKRIPEDTVIQRYRFVAGNTYGDMAAAYGSYLRSLEGMEATAGEEIPVHVELVGAIDKTEVKFGVPVDSIVATTSFTQASQIMKELTEAGIPGLRMRMTGWANNGVHQSVLTSVRTLWELGGDQGMKQLIAEAKAAGVPLSFDGINCFAYDSGLFEGFVPFLHSARFVTRELTKLYPYSMITYLLGDFYDPFYLVKPSYAKDNASRLIGALRDRGAEGIGFRDIGSLLSGDYYDRDPVTREQVKQMNIDTLREARDAGLHVTVKTGNDYTLPYADLITDMELTGSDYALLDEQVPFYQIALHGLRDYTGKSINLEGDYQTELLECAEYGAGLNFTFMEEDTLILRDSAYSCYTSAAWERWKEQILPMIQRYQSEMAGLNTKHMTGHEQLSRDVAVTDYEDGTRVYVNYSNQAWTDGNVTVPARDYLVKGGCGQ